MNTLFCVHALSIQLNVEASDSFKALKCTAQPRKAKTSLTSSLSKPALLQTHQLCSDVFAGDASTSCVCVCVCILLFDLICTAHNIFWFF